MERQLFEKYILGTCTPEERSEFEAWYEQNCETPEFDRLSLEILAKIAPYADGDMARDAFRRLHRRMHRDQQPRRKKIMRLAAAACLILAIAGVGIGFVTRQDSGKTPEKSEALTVAYSPAGQNLTVILPDSSLIMLKPDSRIIYDRNTFDTDRNVYLFGDAYCKIAHKADSSPFRVSCGDATVNVLGTSFDVRSHDNDREFELMLYDGSVRLVSSFLSHADTMKILPGEIVRIDKTSGLHSISRLESLSPDSLTLCFYDSTLGDIVNSLQRRYGKHIAIRDPRRLSGKRLFAIFSVDQSLDDIMTSLAILSGARVSRPDKETIELL